MFMAVLFTITIRWTPPKCPSTDECISKMWSKYSGTLFGF